MKLEKISLIIMSVLLLTGIANAIDFAEPVRIEAAGKPVDTGNVGHAAPFVCDFDGDGVKDLLVGEFSGGVLWIYKNEGTNSKPKLGEGVKFKDGKPDGTVPCG
ncbi:MAG: VCBS repeat-containing protein [Phycisphaerae bacterium]|nr:VCBS repeat-containing protein [Phycisphaerae bacterium]